MKLLRNIISTAVLATAPFQLLGQHNHDHNHDHPHGHDHGDSHDHHHSDEPEWTELFGDASLPTVWHSMAMSEQRIATALDTGTLDGVANWAETIHIAAHALMDQIDLGDPEKQRRLNGALQQAAEIADQVLDGAQHSETEQTARAFRRLSSAVRLSSMRLPETVTKGPADDPRFAEAGSHSHEDEEHSH